MSCNLMNTPRFSGHKLFYFGNKVWSNHPKGRRIRYLRLCNSKDKKSTEKSIKKENRKVI
jgi:hypothetical protein